MSRGSPMANRPTKDNSKALAAFMARKVEINWSDVGTLAHYATKLREISDSAFHEGEHANG